MPTAAPRIRTTGLTTFIARHDTYTSGAPSQYPDSDSDNNSNPTLSYTTTLRLRASIAAVPETLLREIMVRLVDRSPGFQHAVAKELFAASTPAPDNILPSPRRKRRRSGRRSLDASADRPCVNCGQQCKVDGGDRDAVCVYHPGRLEEEVYDFPSRTPEGRTFQVRRKITMWSCCDEDAGSPGCVSAMGHVRAGGRPRAASHATANASTATSITVSASASASASASGSSQVTEKAP